MTVQPTRDQLREAADKATDGPWEAYGTTIAAITGSGSCQGCSGLVSPAHEPSCYWSEIAAAGEADAEFIAAARTALPQLLDQLDQAEAERDRNLRNSREAKKRAIRAEARIKAVEDVLDKVEAGESWFRPVDFSGTPFPITVDTSDIRRALEG